MSKQVQQTIQKQRRQMKLKISLFVLLLLGSLLYGQDKSEQTDNKLNIQQVEVTKSYTPSILDVFKLRTSPPETDSLMLPKKEMNYQFLSIPVLETFVPNKAKPLQLERSTNRPAYNSQLKLQLGNLGQMQLDGAAAIALDREQYIGIDLLWDQKGDIPDVLLPSAQSQFLVNFSHDYYSTNYHAAHQLRLEANKNNFFGISESNEFLAAFLEEGLDPVVKRNYFDAVSDWEWYDNPVQKLQLNLSLVNDNFSTAEQIVSLKSVFRLPIWSAFIDFKPQLELVNSEFQKEYYTNTALNIQQFNLGTVIQFFQVNRNFKYKIGARVQWLSSPWEDGGEQLFYYPDVMLSYTSKKNNITPYLKINGGLKNTSYNALSLQNPFVAPSLQLRPVDEQYHIKLGFDTQFNSGIDFGFEGFYKATTNTPLFKRLAYSNMSPKTMSYTFSNAYEVVFDTQTQYGAKISMHYQINENNQIIFDLQHNTYEQEEEIAAWNLPEVEFNLEGNFLFFKRIRLHTSLRYWGNRQVAYRPIFVNQPPELNVPEIQNLAALTSLKAELSYMTNSPWSFFAKTQINLGADTPQFWLDYPQFPALYALGIRYNFNLSL